ncbi:hypothetical protein [Labilibaculum sp.]|uniref:hypothetical protein n=1 Tax=Labilibaculum sp. TaxID=2060723 RepID=UPI003566D9B4
MIQKIFLSIALIGFLFSYTANAKTIVGEVPQSVIKSRYIMNDNLFGKTILSGALTNGVQYDSGFGLQGMLDHRFMNRVSMGLQGNLYFLESDLSSTRQLSASLRINYHLIKEKRFESNDWDWYIGGNLGADLEGGNKKISQTQWFTEIHTGLRYKLNYKWLLFAEIGSRNSALGLAISL